MRQVNIHEAKTHLSRLVEEVAAVEEIVIAKAGRPIAKLVPLASEIEPRRLGSLRGIIWLADNFDAPLPETVLASLFAAGG